MDAEPAATVPAAYDGWRGIVLKIGHFVEPVGQPAEAIFGTLVAAAVLATKGQKGESGAEIFWSGLLVLFLYWTAHVYADVLGERLETKARPGWSGIVRAAVRDWSMLRGSLGPLLIYGAVLLFGAGVETSVLTALWSTVVLMALWGLIAALRGGSRGLELVVETLVCAALGFLVLVLKIFVH